MSLALKRTFPHLYTFLKKYEKHMPARYDNGMKKNIL